MGCDLHFLKFFCYPYFSCILFEMFSHTCHKNVSVYFNLILSQGRKCCGVGEPGAWCSYVTRAAKDPSVFTITEKAFTRQDFLQVEIAY